MAVYYKFKSARDYDSISMGVPFISVGTLKEKIFESKHLGRGTDFDLVVTNAQTNEEYIDEAMLIPKNTSVLIRRVPGRPLMPIVTEQKPKMEHKVEDAPLETEDTEWDEFGNDSYAIPEVPLVQLNIAAPDAPKTNKAEEESKIKALIDTPALDWQRQGTDGFGPGRGFGRGMGGRMGGRGFGLERKTPPQGYVCHRCKVPGHFIQHCATNGDPNYDIKRVKPPTGIPKSMLMANPDGSYALPSGAVAVLKPNEAAFEKEIEGLPSTRSVGDLPPELHCPLCKEVMKDAVLTSKCCFKSFCDKCIRDHIISKTKCVCRATNILADDLLPNKTLRDTINRILESGNSSAENAGSTFQVQDMESARNPQPNVPSPPPSAVSKKKHKPSPDNAETPYSNMKEQVNPVIILQQFPQKLTTAKAADVSEATLESMSVKELASQGSAPLAEDEVQQKLVLGEAGKKKKKKKARMPPNDLWKASQDLTAQSYMTPVGPSPYNPYWGGMQPGMEGYMNTYVGPMPFMGYGLGPLDMPFGGMIPPDPFAARGYMMPVVPPQRDLGEFGMGMNAGPPAMREEFEAQKADLRRRRENESQAEREFPRDRKFGREVSSKVDISSVKCKSIPQSLNGDYHPRNSRQPERSSPKRSTRDLENLSPRTVQIKSDHKRSDCDRDRDYDYADYDRGRDRDRDRDRDRGKRGHHHRHHSRFEPSAKALTVETAKPTSSMIVDRKHKARVLSPISFPEEELTAKKHKLSSSGEAPAAVPGGPSASYAHHKSSLSVNGHNESSSVKATPVSAGGRCTKSSSAATINYETSDDIRHFKRKPSRYELSSPPPVERKKEAKHSRERERNRDPKHR